MLRFITDFADQAVVLPVAGTFALSLAAQRWWRAAGGWAVASLVLLAVMLAAKLAFAACGEAGGETLAGLSNPSGHTAVAGLVAGGMARVFARGVRPSLAWPAIAGLLAAVAIGMTRVALGEHSVADVVAATPIGVSGGVLAAWLMGPPPQGCVSHRRSFRPP